MQPITEETGDHVIAGKILHILDIFPKISPSMLQIGLGSGLPTSLWKPVLDQLLEQKRIFKYQVESVSPGGRCQSLTVISSMPEA